MKKRITLAVLAVVCIVLIIVLIDPGATKPWTWANRLSAEDVDNAVLWSEFGILPFSEEETEDLVKQINQTNRLHFQKNKHLAGSTPTCGITLTVNETVYHLGYYGIFEMRYGEDQWWIRSERFIDFMEPLLEKCEITSY